MQSSGAVMSIRHFLSPILRRFRSGSGNGEMESGAENGADDDNDIFDVLDDKENHERGQPCSEKTRDAQFQFLNQFQSRPSPGTGVTFSTSQTRGAIRQ